MKILAIILGIFCLLISAYPCCMIDNCEDESITATTESGEEQDECGVCSPFIRCGTCTGFVPCVNETVTVFNFQVAVDSNLFGLSFNCVENDYVDQQWQPPKQVIIS